MSSKVSIVIPMYNGQRFIRETIKHVLDQTYAAFEVIVVDDGSTDRGREVVRCLLSGEPRMSLIVKPHMGIASTRNVGLAWSSPESQYILFLDQDDVLAPTTIKTLVGKLDERPDAVGAYGIADYVSQEGSPYMSGHFARMMRRRRRMEDGRVVLVDIESDVRWSDLFISNHLYPPSAVLLRRPHVVQVGGFDESYQVADDWDMMIRVCRRGPIVPHDEVLVGYRRHAENASSNRRRNVSDTRAIWANTYFSPSNTKIEKRLLRRIWRFHQRATAARKLSRALESGRGARWRVAMAEGLDAAAHAVLPRPLRAWRTRIGPGIESRCMDQFRLGERQQQPS